MYAISVLSSFVSLLTSYLVSPYLIKQIEPAGAVTQSEKITARKGLPTSAVTRFFKCGIEG